MRRYVVAFGALGRLVVALLPTSWQRAIDGIGPMWIVTGEPPTDGPTNPMSHGKR